MSPACVARNHAGRRPGLEAVERGRVQVDRIEEAAVGGMVGAGAVALGREQRVERVEPDGHGALRPRALAETGERGEVADAAVPDPPQRIEMRRHAVGPRALRQLRG